MSITTPALLIPAISLLLLAYTNRFLVMAQLIRQLKDAQEASMKELVLRQVKNLKKRLLLTKLMQTFGILSFLLCTFSMFAFFVDYNFGAKVLFGVSLISLSVSLLFSLYEVYISMDAINVELENISNLKD